MLKTIIKDEQYEHLWATVVKNERQLRWWNARCNFKPRKGDEHTETYILFGASDAMKTAWMKQEFMRMEEELGEDWMIKGLNEDFWNTYEQQVNLGWNEFMGQLEMTVFLDLVDYGPAVVKIKGTDPIYFNSKRMYISSNYTPYEWYSPKVVEKHLAAFKKRLHHFYYFYDTGRIQEFTGPNRWDMMRVLLPEDVRQAMWPLLESERAMYVERPIQLPPRDDKGRFIFHIDTSGQIHPFKGGYKPREFENTSYTGKAFYRSQDDPSNNDQFCDCGTKKVIKPKVSKSKGKGRAGMLNNIKKARPPAQGPGVTAASKKLDDAKKAYEDAQAALEEEKRHAETASLYDVDNFYAQFNGVLDEGCNHGFKDFFICGNHDNNNNNNNNDDSNVAEGSRRSRLGKVPETHVLNERGKRILPGVEPISRSSKFYEYDRWEGKIDREVFKQLTTSGLEYLEAKDKLPPIKPKYWTMCVGIDEDGSNVYEDPVLEEGEILDEEEEDEERAPTCAEQVDITGSPSEKR